MQSYTDIYLFKKIYTAVQLTLSELQWLLPKLNLFLLTPKISGASVGTRIQKKSI